MNRSYQCFIQPSYPLESTTAWAMRKMKTIHFADNSDQRFLRCKCALVMQRRWWITLTIITSNMHNLEQDFVSILRRWSLCGYQRLVDWNHVLNDRIWLSHHSKRSSPYHYASPSFDHDQKSSNIPIVYINFLSFFPTHLHLLFFILSGEDNRRHIRTFSTRNLFSYWICRSLNAR